jgi:hypothetical protein
MTDHFFSSRPPVGCLLMIACLLLGAGCSGEGQPPGEVIEIETIEIIEPDAAGGQQPTNESPAPPEPSADAST